MIQSYTGSANSLKKSSACSENNNLYGCYIQCINWSGDCAWFHNQNSLVIAKNILYLKASTELHMTVFCCCCFCIMSPFHLWPGHYHSELSGWVCDILNQENIILTNLKNYSIVHCQSNVKFVQMKININNWK